MSGNDKTRKKATSSAASTAISSASNASDTDSGQLTLAAFNQGLAAMKNDIIESLRTEIATVRTDSQEKYDSLHTSLLSQDARLVEVENGVRAGDIAHTALLATVAELKAEVQALNSKCQDLEGRQRRSNFRVVGVPSSIEGPRPTEFMANFLQEILELEEKPVLDRAHRSLTTPKPRKPGDTRPNPPRPFVVCAHHFQTKELIMKRHERQVTPSSIVGTKSIFSPTLSRL